MLKYNISSTQEKRETMASHPSIGTKQKLIILISIMLCAGFLATSLASYFVSKSAIRDGIVRNELPITSDNVYSEIQKDLIRPIFVSSVMASDTFLRDWAIAGESDAKQITKYLNEIKQRYQAVTSFFVSDKSKTYYHASGILKKVSEKEWRDAWYFRVKEMKQPYEINVDVDLANRDAMTVFINYRVFDYKGNFIGATGVGLTVDAVTKLVNEYQQRYQRSIFFVDQTGKLVVATPQTRARGTDINRIDGLAPLAKDIMRHGSGSFEYYGDGSNRLLNVRFIPELNWYLLVERIENEAIAGIRNILFINLAVCAAITIIIIFSSILTINRYQSQLEEMATTDKLTGLFNRQAFDILMLQFNAEQKRSTEPFCLLLFDVDHFKEVNDSFGHLAGDKVLSTIAAAAKSKLRESDILCRWGGEEFLAVLKRCSLTDACHRAEEVRAAVEEISISYGDQAIRVTVSLGVTEGKSGIDLDSLLSKVDMALYKAKETGRNRYAVSS